MSTIDVRNVYKTFKVYFDKGSTLKEKALNRNRRRYESREVLRGVSFSAEKGEAVGLIGRNGCGKSTLLKLLSRIMVPDSGSIEVQGRVSSLIELGAGFHPDMSGRENIYINAAIFGLTRKEIDARLDEIIAFSELEEFLDNPVRTYSSGMYMRLAFSVAINVDADVLLIDEILAVGDANFQAKCFKKLREIKAKGVTIVLVSHDTNTVATFCDKALWLNDGILRAQGRAKTVVDDYLGFMNEELYNALQAEERQKNEIDYSANRFGLRKIEITDAAFADEDGAATRVLRQGEKAVLKISYRVNEPIEQYNFGMGFYTMDYVCIYGVNSQMDGHLVSRLPREGTVTFAIDNVSLLSGQYILQVAVVDGNGTPMDYYRNYMQFSVVSSAQAIGICNFAHNWIFVQEGGD